MVSRPLKILQICSSASWGGMEMHVSVLAEQLEKKGHTVEALCAHSSSLDLDLKSKNITTYPFAPKGYVDISAILGLTKLLSKNSYDIIHAHYSKDLWTIIPATTFFRKTPIVFIKHIGTQKAKKDPFHRCIYGRISHTIAISQVIADNLLKTHPIMPDRLSIIHHGLDLSLFNNAKTSRAKIRAEFELELDHILIGIIGRLQEGKGHLEFLRMAKEISPLFPKSRFVVVGEPTRGEEFRAEKIYNIAKQINLENKLIFTGFRKDIPALLSAMDIFTFPSRAEAFGLVLIEAMAAGLPVISCKSDGILDIVQEGVNGLLVQPENVPQLVIAVSKLLKNKDMRNRLATAARDTVEKKFTIERMIKQNEDIYHRCLDELSGTKSYKSN